MEALMFVLYMLSGMLLGALMIAILVVYKYDKVKKMYQEIRLLTSDLSDEECYQFQRIREELVFRMNNKIKADKQFLDILRDYMNKKSQKLIGNGVG